MQTEIILFWVVAAGFLIADNLVLLPAGRDYLGFGMRGRFTYSAATRLEARGRELVFLNPLNLFQRAAVTTRGLGRLHPAELRSARRQVEKALPTLNTFSWIGYSYLIVAACLASLSFGIHFGSVLASFLATHAVFSLISIALLVRRRSTLGLSGHQAAIFAVEAMLVPAYTINLGKRLWSRQVLDLPAMSLGIRQAKRIDDELERELALHQLRERLELLESMVDDAPGQVVPKGGNRTNGTVAAVRENDQETGRVSSRGIDDSPGPPSIGSQAWLDQMNSSSSAYNTSKIDLIREAKACLMG